MTYELTPWIYCIDGQAFGQSRGGGGGVGRRSQGRERSFLLGEKKESYLLLVIGPALDFGFREGGGRGEEGSVADDDHPSSYSRTWTENELLDGSLYCAVPRRGR